MIGYTSYSWSERWLPIFECESNLSG